MPSASANNLTQQAHVNSLEELYRIMAKFEEERRKQTTPPSASKVSAPEEKFPTVIIRAYEPGIQDFGRVRPQFITDDDKQWDIIPWEY